jgi:hypothetical protein
VIDTSHRKRCHGAEDATDEEGEEEILPAAAIVAAAPI